MSVEANIELKFKNNTDASYFSKWLYESGHTNKSVSGTTVEVTLYAHGDRIVVLEEATNKGAEILKDDVIDDY